MTTLRLLSGGAAQGLVKSLESDWAAAGIDIAGAFGAVGLMRSRLEGGEATDVVILTDAIVRDLAAAGVVLADTIATIGGVATAVAVPAGHPRPAIGDETALRRALAAAGAIYFPDPAQATAGIHFASVLERLGLAVEAKGRLRTFPNGMTAMAALAGASELNAIGCTQVTEIMATPGVELVAPLPPGFDLTTRYTAAVVARSSQVAAARSFITRLTAPAHAELRSRCGFV